jgi:hypothetical protein
MRDIGLDICHSLVQGLDQQLSDIYCSHEHERSSARCVQHSYILRRTKGVKFQLLFNEKVTGFKRSEVLTPSKIEITFM